MSIWVRGSRQKSHFLPAATKLLSEKSASATFFQCSAHGHMGARQPAKITLFAGGNEGCV
jgi:hypothetical protein